MNDERLAKQLAFRLHNHGVERTWVQVVEWAVESIDAMGLPMEPGIISKRMENQLFAAEEYFAAWADEARRMYEDARAVE